MPKLGDWLDPDEVRRLKSAAEERATEAPPAPAGPVLSREEALAWIAKRLPGLPIRHGDVHRELWGKRRLGSADCPTVPGGTDDYSARILTSALQAGRSLLVVMPQSHREAVPLLLSTIILMLWRESGSYRGSPTIMYFSHLLGIRRHLAATAVGELNLASVFPQTWVGDHSSHGPPRVDPWHRAADGSPGVRWKSSRPLPRLICSCGPADPAAVLARFRPDWIVVDCANAEDLPWLAPLLRAAADLKRPVVAWSSSPSSTCASDFQAAGSGVFRWSQSADDAPYGRSSGAKAVDVASLLAARARCRFSPLVMEGGSSATISDLLGKAARLLYHSTAGVNSTLVRDAATLALRCIRLLSRLCVPLSIYEERSRYHWGIRSVSEHMGGLARFGDALSRHGANGSAFAAILGCLEEVVSAFGRDDPPMWQALVELAAGPPMEQERLLVFHSRASREMFELALQARCGIAGPELRDSGIDLAYSGNLLSWLGEADGRNGLQVQAVLPVVVGLPGAPALGRLSPLLGLSASDVLVYPHEVPALERRLRQLSAIAEADLGGNAAAVAAVIGEAAPRVDGTADGQSTLGEPKTMLISGAEGARYSPTQTGPLMEVDPVAEIERLLGQPDDPESAPDPQTGGGVGAEPDLVVDRAVEVRLEGGWLIRFEPDDTVQVVRAASAGSALSERKADSLRRGEKVLVVSGVRRQSLYELLLARLHGMPGVEVHVALIQRWHDDLAQGYYERWQQQGRGLDDLLVEIQRLGSSIKTAQALRGWITGATYSPDAAADIRRVAQVLDLPFVQQQWRQIHQAAHRLWGLHIGLSQRLNKRLRQEAAGVVEGGDPILDEVFDEDLGLSLRDFRDSMMILRVESVVAIGGPVLRSSLAILTKADET